MGTHLNSYKRAIMAYNQISPSNGLLASQKELTLKQVKKFIIIKMDNLSAVVEQECLLADYKDEKEYFYAFANLMCTAGEPRWGIIPVSGSAVFVLYSSSPEHSSMKRYLYSAAHFGLGELIPFLSARMSCMDADDLLKENLEKQVNNRYYLQ